MALETIESHNARLTGRIDPSVKSTSRIVYNATVQQALEKVIERLKYLQEKKDELAIAEPDEFWHALDLAIKEVQQLMKEHW